MWIGEGINIILLSICIIMLIPFVFQFTRVIVRYLINKYLSKENIYVTYKENGTITSKIKISYMENGEVHIQHNKIRTENGS